MFYFCDDLERAPTHCGKCKSKKLKRGTTNDVRTEDGHTLIRRVPRWRCKKCKADNVMMHHMMCEDALERWLDKDTDLGTMQ